MFFNEILKCRKIRLRYHILNKNLYAEEFSHYLLFPFFLVFFVRFFSFRNEKDLLSANNSFFKKIK